MKKRINIAITGGPCTGKSTLAAALFSFLKEKMELDYDLVTEESRKLKGEFGHCRSPFERLYLWRQQDREERRSAALNGFVTDSPLFHQYVSARMFEKEERDALAVRELFRMCLETEGRYQLIVIPKNPNEVPYKTDKVRVSKKKNARKKHELMRSFAEHFFPEKVLFVSGTTRQRVLQVIKKLKQM